MMHTPAKEMPEASARGAPFPGARAALALLLLINLFNYIDRQVLAAVVGPIKATFFGPNGAGAGETLTAVMKWFEHSLGFKPEDALVGLLGTAFMVVYMIGAPVFGRLAERTSPWLLVGVGVILWSLASGASGLAGTFDALSCRHRRGGLRAGGAGDHFRSISRQDSRAGAGLVLHGDSRGQRTRLRARRVDRQLRPWRVGSQRARREARKLALGVLPGGRTRHRARVVELLHARSRARAG